MFPPENKVLKNWNQPFLEFWRETSAWFCLSFVFHSFIFIFRQCQLLDQGYLVEAANLSDLYFSFTSQASSGIATDQNLQQLVCEKIDGYYENVLNNTDQSETTPEFTKNLIKCKQDLVKDFIKIHLSQKSKECPHCRSPLREVRLVVLVFHLSSYHT